MRQFAAQPSPDILLPSSQASSEVRLPSPQPGVAGSSGGLSSTIRSEFPPELVLLPEPSGVPSLPVPPPPVMCRSFEGRVLGTTGADEEPEHQY